MGHYHVNNDRSDLDPVQHKLDSFSASNQFSAACSVVAAVLFRAVLRCVELSLRPNEHSAGHRSKTKHMNVSFGRAENAKVLDDSQMTILLQTCQADMCFQVLTL